MAFEEALTAFGDPFAITVPDPDHSETEARFLLLGRTTQQRLVVVVHIERGETLRLIRRYGGPVSRSTRGLLGCSQAEPQRADLVQVVHVVCDVYASSSQETEP